MFHITTCPICSHKLRVDEAAMGKRHVCPNCQAPFIAGNSTPLPAALPPAAPAAPPMTLPPPQTPAPPSLNKTILGEMDPPEPPLRFTCPRCKKSQEVPASDAGLKRPCPGCGQRLQIPTRPVPPPQPVLQKTMLVLDDTAIQPASPPIPLKPLDPGPAPAAAGPQDKARHKRCLECGQDVSGWEQVFSCPDCGSVFCSSRCIRDHRDHAHGVKPPVVKKKARKSLLDRIQIILDRNAGQPSYYLAPNIPPRKLIGSAGTCRVKGGEKVLALIDCTVFGSASDCVLFTNKALHYHSSAGARPNPARIPYAELGDKAFAKYWLNCISLGDGDYLNISGSTFSRDVLLATLMAVRELVVEFGDEQDEEEE